MFEEEDQNLLLAEKQEADLENELDPCGEQAENN